MTIVRPQMTRRSMLAGALGALLASCSALRDARSSPAFAEQMRMIESRLGGRVGVHALDTSDGAVLGYNENARFAMCSTFKTLLAACVLSRADAGALNLERQILIEREHMLSHAPVTSRIAGQGGMNVRDLCAAVVEVSDNPAANLLLSLVGGPEGLTRFLRKIGDRVTRLDRFELELNTNIPGDPRDTTTPRAMVETLHKIVLGDVLNASSRALLTRWLTNASTGLRRIRAGLPSDWRAGDKTGTGANGAVNDTAILWPPNRAPLVVAIYMSDSTQSVAELEGGHAQIARLISGSPSSEARA